MQNNDGLFSKTLKDKVINLLCLNMSLITSNSTTKEQLRFFNRLQQQFHKKSFSNPNYHPKPHPLTNINDKVQLVQAAIHQQMSKFIQNIKNIIESARDTRIDYFFIYNHMKTLEFFKDVADLIKEDIVAKNMKIQQESHLKSIQLKQMRKKQQNSSMNTNVSHPPPLDLDSTRSISENLYYKAKVLSEDEFSDLCDRVFLREKVIINKIQKSKKYEEWEQDKEVLKRVNNYLNYKKTDLKAKKNHEQSSSQANYLEPQSQLHFLELISRLIEKDPSSKTKVVSQFVCNRPCCQHLPDPQDNRPNKAISLMETSTSMHWRSQSQGYTTNKQQQYFDRYYKRQGFNIDKVESVSKTKRQEMERLQDEYRIKEKVRKRKNMRQ